MCREENIGEFNHYRWGHGSSERTRIWWINTTPNLLLTAKSPHPSLQSGHYPFLPPRRVTFNLFPPSTYDYFLPYPERELIISSHSFDTRHGNLVFIHLIPPSHKSLADQGHASQFHIPREKQILVEAAGPFFQRQPNYSSDRMSLGGPKKNSRPPPGAGWYIFYRWPRSRPTRLLRGNGRKKAHRRAN